MKSHVLLRSTGRLQAIYYHTLAVASKMQKKAIEENYCGCYASLADYAEELTEETTQIPEHLAFYIDYEKMGRDMELGGDVSTIETGYQEVYIFWNH
nr:antirestriction protein ArdA [Alteromonas confluentis]